MQLFKPGAESIRGRILPAPPASDPAQPAPTPTPEPPPAAAEQVHEVPIWQPTAASSARPVATTAATIPNEDALLAVCTRPIDADDGHRLGNDRKERELAALFDELTSAQAIALHRRLASPQAHDELAMAFEHRIAMERRKRLLAYLGSAKRRAALGR